MKHDKLVKFSSNLNVKPPLHKRKAPLLTTFWRRFWSVHLLRFFRSTQNHCFWGVLMEAETVSQIFPTVSQNTVETRFSTTIKIR